MANTEIESRLAELRKQKQELEYKMHKIENEIELLEDNNKGYFIGVLEYGYGEKTYFILGIRTETEAKEEMKNIREKIHDVYWVKKVTEEQNKKYKNVSDICTVLLLMSTLGLSESELYNPFVNQLYRDVTILKSELGMGEYDDIYEVR